MDLIAPPSGAGRWVCVLDSPDRKARATFLRAQKEARSRRRRRRLLVLFVLAAVVTGSAALLRGGSYVEVNLAVDAALVLFVGVLRESKKRRAERAAKVRNIRPARRRTGREELRPLAAGGRR